MTGNYNFLPFLRRGLGNAIPDPIETSTPHPRFPVTVRLGDKNGPYGDAGDAAVDLRLLGPGEVTGIDTRLISRVEPAHLSRNLSPNYFAHVEFSLPDLPWMFSPYAPTQLGTAKRLTPWMVLVAVPADVATLERREGISHALLTFTDPESAKTELPPLKDAFAWAHVQVLMEGAPTGADRVAAIKDILQNKRDRIVARLVCPRQLQPNTTYHACVVPTFKVGVQAALGLPLDANPTLEFAWTADGLRVEGEPLPVYYHWEFTTAEAGDFESLVRRLTPRPVSKEVGLRELDIGNAGSGLPTSPIADKKILLEGALWAPEAERGRWPGATAAVRAQYQQDFQTALKQVLDAPALLAATSVNPTVAPPLYGRWMAARDRVPDASPDDTPTNAQRPIWFRDLNLDPRERSVAGFGTRVIQREQEQFMHMAWTQIGDIKDANRLLIRTQFAREVNNSLYRRHLSRMPIDWLLALTWRLHWRIFFNGESLSDLFARCWTWGRGGALGSPWTVRFGRPGGGCAILRTSPRHGGRERGLPALIQDSGGGAADDWSIADELPSGDPPIGEPSTCSYVPHEPPVDGSSSSAMGGPVDDNPYSDCGYPTTADVDGIPPKPNYQDSERPGPVSTDPAVDSDDAKAARKNARDVAGYLTGIGATQERQFQSLCTMNVTGIRASIMAFLNPEVTSVSRVRSRLNYDTDEWDPVDPLHWIMAHPKIDKPMYQSLRDYRQEHLLPGLDRIPADSITLLKTNPRFIEAFMVGLNHEFSREMIWREYPTDQRGTVFRQFWDPAGTVPAPGQPAPTPEEQYDIPPIVGFNPNFGIGKNAETFAEGHFEGDPDDSGRVVLLIRGELLRRYPTADIYAVRSVWAEGTTALDRDPALVETEEQRVQHEKRPIFRGTLSPDVTFFGFDLTIDEARGGNSRTEPAGWYFVIQQQPFDPRFGLDVAVFPDGGGTATIPPLKPAEQDGVAIPGSSPWDQLTWIHVAGANPTPESLKAVKYINLDVPLNRNTSGESFPTGSFEDWPRNSSNLAEITWQLPVRILIHAQNMLAEG